MKLKKKPKQQKFEDYKKNYEEIEYSNNRLMARLTRPQIQDYPNWGWID